MKKKYIIINCLPSATLRLSVKPNQARVILTSILFILVASNFVQAQTPVTAQTIRWNAGPVNNVTTGLTEPDGDYLITGNNGKIEWYNTEGTVKYNFTIQSATNTWLDVNVPGTALFSFQFESQPGQLSITKQGSVITIHVKLYMEETPQEYEMTVTNFTIL